MKKNKKKVCIFTLYCKEGASSNFRILMFIDDFSTKFETKIYSFWNKKYVNTYMGNKSRYIISIVIQYLLNVIKRSYQIFFIATKCDVVIFQKGVIPGLPLTFMKYLHKKNIKVILDIDDAVYLSSHDYSDKIAKDADVIVVGNNLLREHYVQINQNVVILPTVDYSPAYEIYKKDTFINKSIGWIGSKPTINNLEIVTNAINKVVNTHPEVSFDFICNSDYGFLKAIKNSKFIPWTLNGYIKAMSKFTIGIMPLYDTPYNRGKCGFKLIQYMNLNKPIIASPVGVNKDIVGNCGIIAETEDEWVEAIESLLFNEHLYREFEDKIETEFKNKYSYSKILTLWTDLIEKA